MGELHRVRLVRQFVEALKPEEIPKELAEFFVIPEGRNYVDVDVRTETAEKIRDVADHVFWTREQRTHGKDIRAAHVTRTLIERELRREKGQSKVLDDLSNQLGVETLSRLAEFLRDLAQEPHEGSAFDPEVRAGVLLEEAARVDQSIASLKGQTSGE